MLRLPRFAAVLALFTAGSLSTACARAINPGAVNDALTAVRVKTALVNDAGMTIGNISGGRPR